MEQKSIRLKEYAYLLRVNREKIIEMWLESPMSKDVLAKCDMDGEKGCSKLFYDFFDCQMGMIEWDASIAECPVKLKLLRFFKENDVTVSELYRFNFALKNVIASFLYEKEVLSYGLQKDLDTLFLLIMDELVYSYGELEEQESSHHIHSNLLNEYKKAVDLSNIVSKTNTKGVITYVNDKFVDISGYSRSELMGKPHNIVRHHEMPSSAFKDMWDTIKNKRPWSGVVTNLKKDGRKYVVDTTVVPILDIDGDISEYIAIRHDVTEFEEAKEQLTSLNMAMKKKVSELYDMTSTLEEQATTDDLTGILNRMKFNQFFEMEIDKSDLRDAPLGLMMIDIDHFKKINDTYGHAAGDEVLKEFVRILSGQLVKTDIFARWGGEEFAVLLPGKEIKQCLELAETLRSSVESHDFGGAGRMTCSFGVVEKRPGDTKHTLFARADEALYRAKQKGRNRLETDA